MNTPTLSLLKNTKTGLYWDGRAWQGKTIKEAKHVTPIQLAFMKVAWCFDYVRIIGTSISC